MFGAKVGDIKLMSLSVVKEHCSVKFDATGIYVIGKYCSLVFLLVLCICLVILFYIIILYCSCCSSGRSSINSRGSMLLVV